MKSSMSMLLLGLILVGCSGGDQKTAQKSETSDVKEVKITAENQKTLFPFAEGNTWVYDAEITRQTTGQTKQTGSEEIEYRVLKVTNDSAKSQRAIIGVFQSGEKRDEQEWTMDDSGLFQTSMKAARIPYSPKQPVIKFPVKEGSEMKWDGSGLNPIGKQGKMKYVYKCDGMQTVDTSMGSMNALFMQSAGTFTSSSADGASGTIGVNSWFTPGVGLVRYRQVIAVKAGQSAITLRLKSYTVKK